MVEKLAPDWVPSPRSTVPLEERASSSKAAAEAQRRATSHIKFLEAHAKAANRLYGKPRKKGMPGRSAIASCLRILRRSGHRQKAKELLAVFNAGEAGRPKADRHQYELAKQVQNDIASQRKKTPGTRASKKAAYGRVAQDNGVSAKTVSRAFRSFGSRLEVIEEAAALLAAAHKKDNN